MVGSSRDRRSEHSWRCTPLVVKNRPHLWCVWYGNPSPGEITGIRHMSRSAYATNRQIVRPDQEPSTLLGNDALPPCNSGPFAMLDAALDASKRPPTSPFEEGPLSIDQVCGFTGLGRTMISKMIKSGELTARKAGRRTLVMRTDLWTWLASLPVLKPKASEEGE